MQHLVILEPEPWGLPLNETLLPQHLKRNGYRTHAIGKWHLGFFRKEYTPTYRGFDTHFGYWQGLQDYYDHTVHATVSCLSRVISLTGFVRQALPEIWWQLHVSCLVINLAVLSAFHLHRALERFLVGGGKWRQDSFMYALFVSKCY